MGQPIERRSPLFGPLVARSALLLAVVAAVLATGPTRAAKARQIAHLRFTPPFWQVWIVDEHGRGARQLTTSPGDKLRVSWFPDGRRVLYNSVQGFVGEVDVTDGAERRIPIELQGMTDAQISPDGKWIAFSVSSANVVDNNDLWRVHPDGRGLERLLALNGLQHFPTWSADGGELLFLSGEGRNEHDIHRLDLTTRRSQPVIAGRLYNFDPAVAPDGSIAFSSNRDGDYEIWVLDAGRDEPRKVAPAPGLDALPAWSPEGKWLVFTSGREGESALWKVRADGKKLRRITPVDQRCRGAAWAP